LGSIPERSHRPRPRTGLAARRSPTRRCGRKRSAHRASRPGRDRGRSRCPRPRRGLDDRGIAIRTDGMCNPPSVLRWSGGKERAQEAGDHEDR
jgi:hypothetical protein